MKFAETYKSSSMVFGIQRSGLLMGGIILRATVHLNSDAILCCLKSVVFLNNSANSCLNREILWMCGLMGDRTSQFSQTIVCVFLYLRSNLSNFRL